MSKLRTVFLGMLVLLVILLCGCGGNRAGETSEGGSEPGASGGTPVAEEPSGETEPSADEEPAAVTVTFEGTDLEGNPVSSDIFAQSKLTMVNVWATFCNPCLQEMPWLGELAAEYEPEDFQLIGIISDVQEGDDQALAESLVEQTGANYPHLLLNESINNALVSSVSGVPTTFFFDAEGTFLGGVVGAREKTAWEDIINELLGAL